MAELAQADRPPRPTRQRPDDQQSRIRCEQTTWVDVTEQLLDAMAENGISIRAGNELTGDDPVPSVVKSLRVAYTLGAETKERGG